MLELYTFFRSSAAFRVRIFEACMKLDAFCRAEPSAQPDAARAT